MRRVVYFAVLDLGFHSQVLRGVMRSARVRPWALSIGCWAYDEPIAFLDHIRPDGVILNAVRMEWTDHLTRRGIPWVNIGYRPQLAPTVTTNVEQIADLAVSHLLSRGFRQFAYFGPSQRDFSTARETAFRARLRQQGFECIVAVDGWGPSAVEWVRSLPKPIAVLAASDNEAFKLIQACREAGVRVPEEIAIVGVDNSLIGLMCTPTLTTVATPSVLIGERAAEVLESMMNGEPGPSAPEFLPPLGLVGRRSTDSTGELESELAQVVRFIRDHAREPISVADVLRAVPVSRRWLERRFRAELGRGVHAEIRAARIEEVKQMLLATDLPLCAIAEEMGFGSAGNLASVFRSVANMTPGQFRQQFQVQPLGPTERPSV